MYVNAVRLYFIFHIAFSTSEFDKCENILQIFLILVDKYFCTYIMLKDFPIFYISQYVSGHPINNVVDDNFIHKIINVRSYILSPKF